MMNKEELSRGQSPKENFPECRAKANGQGNLQKVFEEAPRWSNQGADFGLRKGIITIPAQWPMTIVMDQ